MACRGIAATILVALLGAGIAGCTTTTSSPTGTSGTGPLVIGAIFPLSGPQANGDELAGVQLAADLVNDDGGIKGRKVSIQTDDAATPEEASAAVDKLVNRGVSVIVGTYSSPQALVASARASGRGAIYLEVGAVADAITERGLAGVLRTVADGSMLGRQAASFAHDFVIPGLHLRSDSARVVVMYENDQYGSSVGYGAVDEAARLGLNIVDTITYNAANADFDQLASTLAADRPDVILGAAYLADAISVRQAMLRHSVSVKAIIGTSSTYSSPAFGDALGSAAVGIFSVDKPDDSLSAGGLTPDGRALLSQAESAYRAKTGKSIDSEVMAGFVGGWALFHEILPAAKSLTSSDIWKAATAVDLPYGSEINGAGLRFAPIGQADAGQNERAASVIWEWVGARTRSIVYPPTEARVAARVIPISNCC